MAAACHVCFHLDKRCQFHQPLPPSVHPAKLVANLEFCNLINLGLGSLRNDCTAALHRRERQWL